VLLVALPVDGSAEVELVATYGFSDEETAPWRRFPLSPLNIQWQAAAACIAPQPCERSALRCINAP
jgi:hypothetical protein